MKDKVTNWITKAENDYKTVQNELNSTEPVTDTICFHAQQCVEKYLKAFLCKCNKQFRKTHDLSELITLCAEIDPEFKELFDWEVDELTGYATELRYPDYFYIPSIDEAKEAFEKTKKAREFIRKKLGL